MAEDLTQKLSLTDTAFVQRTRLSGRSQSRAWSTMPPDSRLGFYDHSYAITAGGSRYRGMKHG